MKVLLILVGITSALVSSSQPMDADYWAGSRTSNTANKMHINVVYSPSVAQYGYTGRFNNTLIFWNDLNTNVKFFVPDSVQGNHDTYYVGQSYTPRLYGRFRAYISIDGHVGLTLDDDLDWHKCTVSLYENQIAANNLTIEQTVHIAAHEIGHTMKLAHPDDYSEDEYPVAGRFHRAVPAGEDSIMKKGRHPTPEFGPQIYDKDELKRAWD